MFGGLFNTKVGLALGGGAAKGVAHIGVLKALADADIKIDYVAGTSVGSMVAALYAFDVDIDEIDRLARRLTLSKITTLRFTKTGLFATDSIYDLMVEYLGDVNIEDSRIPLAIVATDITTGRPVVMREGSLAYAVCASSAIPGIYSPVEREGRILVDGGLVQNVPLAPLRDMGAGVTIASHLSSVDQYPTPTHVLDVARNAFEIAVSENTKNQVASADILVAMDLSQFSFRDNTERHDELSTIGYNSCMEKLGKLRWYQRSNLLLYLWRAFTQLAPFKMPNLLTQMYLNSRSK
jgi:NTE family protein